MDLPPVEYHSEAQFYAEEAYIVPRLLWFLRHCTEDQFARFMRHHPELMIDLYYRLSEFYDQED